MRILALLLGLVVLLAPAALPPELPPITPSVTFFGFHTVMAPAQDLLPAPPGQPVKVLFLAPQQTFSSQADMDSFCPYIVGKDNIVYGNDPANPTRIQQVGCVWLSNWIAPNNMNQELAAMQANTVPGYNIAAMRDTAHGDLVQLFDSDGNACGLGYVGAGTYGKQYGFSVVQKGCAPAIDGNYSAIHERGHNFGLLHDTPNNTSGAGIYPDVFGFCAPDGIRRDPMVYPSPCGGNRAPYFGNPNISPYGYPFGDATHNGARVLRVEMPKVANFYPPVGLSAPINHVR